MIRENGKKGLCAGKTPIKKRLLILLFVLAGLCIAALYSGLTIRSYTVVSDKLEAGESIRVVLLTDLHSYIYGDNQEKLINKITNQNPDIILLAGDIADDIVPIEGTRLLLDGIREAAPVYYVSGNHEFWSGDIRSIKELIKSYGVMVLEDDYQEINVNGIPVIVAGLDDPDWTKYDNKDPRKPMNEVFYELAFKDQYMILIAHRPELIELYKQYPFDLVVSGHAHGGQVRIPFLLNGLAAPDQGLFPEYAGGMYEHESLTHIVSRGLSINPRLPRIFNPPEIVVIDILSA